MFLKTVTETIKTEGQEKKTLKINEQGFPWWCSG